MREYCRKWLQVSIVTVCFINCNETQHKNYTIKKQFQDTIKALNFANNTTYISSHFPITSHPYIVIFVPDNNVPHNKHYSQTVNLFLENLNVDKKIDKKDLVFFRIMQIPDNKKSTKRHYGELLAQFIKWLYSYNKHTTIILIGDRNGNSIINYATHAALSLNFKFTIHTIIQLYPIITPTLTSKNIDQTLENPLPAFYNNLFIIYSEYVNTPHYNKSNKLYPSSVPYTSYLPLKNNEQLVPEEFLSPFCAQRLLPSLSQAQHLYPHHKNFVLHWSSTTPTTDGLCFLKDFEVLPSPNLTSLSPTITKERMVSTKIKDLLEKEYGSSLKTKLPYSERSKYFYNSFAHNNVLQKSSSQTT